MPGLDPATGGNVSTFMMNGAEYTVHVFLQTGDFTVNDPGLNVGAVLVGGGGGGGTGVLPDVPGGGGGAGGFLQGRINPASVGVYRVLVGNGGRTDTAGGQTELQATMEGNTMVLAAGGGGAGGNQNRNYNNPGDNDYSGCGGDGIDPPDGAASKVQGCGGGSCGWNDTLGGYGMNAGANSYPNPNPSVNVPDYFAGSGAGTAQPGDMYQGGNGIAYVLNTAYVLGGGGGAGYNGLGGTGGGGNGGQLSIGSSGAVNTGGGGGGGSMGYAGGSGGSGIVLLFYLTPPVPGNEVEYFEPHQCRSPSGRASNIYRHPGRGLPRYQTAWMDSLMLNGGDPNPPPPQQ